MKGKFFPTNRYLMVIVVFSILVLTVLSSCHRDGCPGQITRHYNHSFANNG